tara:strand:- start:6 stop:1262 length:1257 start_codon:yes stop_codon:yes gene_type:complete
VKKLIFGYGATGKSVETYFHKNKIEYFIYDDDKEIEIPKNKKFKDNKFDEIDEIIISPGIKPTHPLLSKIKSKKINLITDIDMYARDRKYDIPIIGVTGTNGKTTFVELITDFINSQGLNSLAVGNIGDSPLNYINEEFDYIVMELSSFQLYYIKNLSLEVGIVLNIEQDHLDWHKNIIEYADSKKKIFKFSKFQINTCRLSNYLSFPEILDEEKINKAKFPEGFSYDDMRVKFYDDFLNAFFILVSKLNLSEIKAYDYLKKTRDLEHRFETVDIINGVTYINDSKSTNFHSVSEATKRVKNGLLIMHGLTKNMSGSKLNIDRENIRMVLVPKDMRIDLNWNHWSEPRYYESIFDLESEILNLTYEFDLESGQPSEKINFDTVLFSCGGASFNDFKNYEERGNFFKEIVSNIKEELNG